MTLKHKHHILGWMIAYVLFYPLALWVVQGSERLFHKIDQQLAQHCLGIVSHPVSCSINKAILDQKLKQGLPAWAQSQIQEDLAPFKKIKRSDLAHYADAHDLLQFEIKQSKALSPQHHRFQNNPVYRIMHDTFQYLAKNHYISETHFLMALGDYFEPKTKAPVPVWVFAKDLAHPFEREMILIPDWMNLGEAAALRPMIRKASQKFPWTAKKSILFWRGGKTGHENTGRTALVASSHEEPTRIDACFTDNKASKDCSFVSPANHLQYKYLVSMDGARATWTRLVWHLHANSLTFKYDSKHFQWFYKGIQPHLHYMPAHNKKTLLEGMDWAEKNPEAAQAIAQRASTFVENHLSVEDMYHYIIVLCQEYTKIFEN